jgi:hypothetical protein
VNELSVGRYLVTILSADLQNTKVTPTPCPENTRYSGNRRNAKSSPVFLEAFFIQSRVYERGNPAECFSYAFDTVPDVARYINLPHSDQSPNIAVAS